MDPSAIIVLCKLCSRQIFLDFGYILSEICKDPWERIMPAALDGRRWTIKYHKLKNRWTKHKRACTHIDVFSMLMPNMDTFFNNFDFF